MEAHIQQFVRQIESGFRALRFAPDLEQGFRHYYAGQTLRRTRIALVIAMVLFAVLAVIYSRRLPPAARAPVFVIDALVIVPVLLATLALSFVRSARHWLPWLLVATVLVAGFGRVALYAWVYVHADGYLLPYEGLLIIVMTSFFLVGMPFYRALSCTVAIVTAYLVAMLMVKVPGSELVMRMYYLVAVAVIGAVGCYIIEYSVRYNYLYNRLSVYYAENDSLTGLSNRRVFMESLERSWRLASREGKPLGVCLVDVDAFKAYNDHFGHLEGDLALKAVAEAIGRSVRRPLDTAARYGGEEFVLVWYDITTSEAGLMAARLLGEIRALALPHPKSQAASVVTVSCGVSVGRPADAVNPIQLLRAADEALYRAKEGGRNRFEVAPPARRA